MNSFKKQKRLTNMNHFFKQVTRRAPSEEEKIYDECHKRLYFTSLRILNNQFEAEEVMHDTLLKYFDRGEKFKDLKERNAWMTRVCVNLSIDRFRKRKSEELRLLSEELKRDNVDENLTQDMPEYSFKGVTVEMVKEALERLAAGYRLVLSLNLFEGYDYEEIAQILNLKEVTVRSQYIRGKARLVEEIEKFKNLR